jgi:alanine dehydrogenase
MQDADYEAAGAKLVDTAAAFQSDIVLKLRPPSIADEVPLFKPSGHLVSYIQPAINKELVEELQKKQMTVIGVLLITLPSTLFVVFAL